MLRNSRRRAGIDENIIAVIARGANQPFPRFSATLLRLGWLPPSAKANQ
jgi:hypothetical protein